MRRVLTGISLSRAYLFSISYFAPFSLLPPMRLYFLSFLPSKISFYRRRIFLVEKYGHRLSWYNRSRIRNIERNLMKRVAYTRQIPSPMWYNVKDGSPLAKPGALLAYKTLEFSSVTTGLSITDALRSCKTINGAVNPFSIIHLRVSTRSTTVRRSKVDIYSWSHWSRFASTIGTSKIYAFANELFIKVIYQHTLVDYSFLFPANSSSLFSKGMSFANGANGKKH